MLLWHWHLFRVKNIDLRARQGRKCQILTLKFLYLGPKVFFCLFLSTAHITTTTSGATTFPYFPKLKYDASCVDLGPKLRVVALLSRHSPKMAKILVEPWKWLVPSGGWSKGKVVAPDVMVVIWYSDWIFLGPGKNWRKTAIFPLNKMVKWIKDTEFAMSSFASHIIPFFISACIVVVNGGHIALARGLPEATQSAAGFHSSNNGGYHQAVK